MLDNLELFSTAVLVTFRFIDKRLVRMIRGHISENPPELPSTNVTVHPDRRLAAENCQSARIQTFCHFQDFPTPNDIHKCVIDNTDTLKSMPELKGNLRPVNYFAKFHALLHLEEVAESEGIKQ